MSERMRFGFEDVAAYKGARGRKSLYVDIPDLALTAVEAAWQKKHTPQHCKQLNDAITKNSVLTQQDDRRLYLTPEATMANQSNTLKKLVLLSRVVTALHAFVPPALKDPRIDVVLGVAPRVQGKYRMRAAAKWPKPSPREGMLAGYVTVRMQLMAQRLHDLKVLSVTGEAITTQLSARQGVALHLTKSVGLQTSPGYQPDRGWVELEASTIESLPQQLVLLAGAVAFVGGNEQLVVEK